MPIFEYRCSACGHRFEKIQKSSSSRPAPCPECGGTAKRLASAPAIQFKGTGWYITDYARKGQSNPETAKGGEGPKGGGEEKGGGEAKGSGDEKASGEAKAEAKERKPSRDDKPSAKPSDSAKVSRGKKRD